MPDSKISWSVAWDDYDPIEFTSPKILEEKPVWADINDPTKIQFWNAIDPNTKVDRRSHMGEYKVVNGYPQNPVF